MNSTHAMRGSAPSCALNAIGTLQPPKEMPKYSCGRAKNRFTKGYEAVSAAPTNDSLTVRGSSRVTSHSAQAHSAANRRSASMGETRRAASGRARVRLTRGSMLRSARSLMMQPALRMTTTPSTKMMSTRWSGWPCPAIHSAHSTGHSRSQMPIGLSSRASRTYS
jgi:hypothetical protein